MPEEDTLITTLIELQSYIISDNSNDSLPNVSTKQYEVLQVIQTCVVIIRV
jgi:hypothetical protein